MSSLRKAASAAMFTALIAGAAQAQVNGAGYPAPGGTTAIGSGDASLGAGREVEYSGFTTSAYDDLYWTFTSVQNPYYVGPGGACPTPGCPAGFNNGFMRYSGVNLSTGIATWVSTRDFTFSDAFGNFFSSSVTLSAQIQPYVAGDPVGPAAAGLPWGPTLGSLNLTAAQQAAIPNYDPAQVVFNVADNPTSASDNFELWTRYTLDRVFRNGVLTAAGLPIENFYNSQSTVNDPAARIVTSSSGAFYSTDVTSTPEPGTLGLFATGLFAVGGFIRRRAKNEA
jgi:hypothetical protein